jgi:hypothetical protein
MPSFRAGEDNDRRREELSRGGFIYRKGVKLARLERF